jgi:Mg/Co/Ni transporter MgtE
MAAALASLSRDAQGALLRAMGPDDQRLALAHLKRFGGAEVLVEPVSAAAAAAGETLLAMAPARRALVLQNMPPTTAAELLMPLHPAARAEAVLGMPPESRRRILDAMSPAGRADTAAAVEAAAPKRRGDGWDEDGDEEAEA